MEHPKPSCVFSLAVGSSPIDLHLVSPFPHLNACSTQEHVDVKYYQQHTDSLPVALLTAPDKLLACAFQA